MTEFRPLSCDDLADALRPEGVDPQVWAELVGIRPVNLDLRFPVTLSEVKHLALPHLACVESGQDRC